MNWLAAMALKATALMLAGALAALFARRKPAAIRHWIWVLTMAGALTLPAASFVMPEVGLPVLPEAASPAAVPLPDAAQGAESAPSGPARSLKEGEPSTSRVSLWLIFWAAGAFLALGRLAHEWIQIRKLMAGSRPWPSRLAEEAARRVGVSRPVEVRVSDSVAVPMAAGTLRPVMLLPESARGWTGERLAPVLLHECAHIARLDHLWGLLSRVAAAVHWFNPLAAWAARRMRLESDRACDERVLASGVDPLAYAEELLHFAMKLPRGKAATPALADRAGFRARLEWILDEGRPRLQPRPAWLAALSVLALTLMSSLAAVTLQPAQSPDSRAPGRAPFHPMSFQESIKALDSPDAVLRKRAAWALGDGEDRRAAPKLITALRDGHPEVRAMACWALGEIKDPGAMPALGGAARDPSVRVREMAALALGEFEDARALPLLAPLERDHHPGVRAAAVWALGEIGTGKARQRIAFSLNDSSPAVRAQAARILGDKHLGQADALIEALSDSSPRVRQKAARSLGLLKSRRAVSPLTSTLRDASPEVRAESAAALGRIGRASALDALLEALNDPSSKVREQVVWALDEISSD